VAIFLRRHSSLKIPYSPLTLSTSFSLLCYFQGNQPAEETPKSNGDCLASMSTGKLCPGEDGREEDGAGRENLATILQPFHI